MKKKLWIGAISAAIILGGAIAVNAIDLSNSKNISSDALQGNEDYKVTMMPIGKSEQLALSDINNNFDDGNSNTVTPKASQAIISLEEAIKIAEKEVDGKVISIEKEHDDGRIKYEIELKTARGEVDVEINATNGKIIEIDYDDDFDDRY